MVYNWRNMTPEEKDELLAKTILEFNCLKPENIDEYYAWYKTHYKMGFWRYTEYINHTYEILNKLAKQGIEGTIKKKEIIFYVLSTKKKAI